MFRIAGQTVARRPPALAARSADSSLGKRGDDAKVARRARPVRRTLAGSIAAWQPRKPIGSLSPNSPLVIKSVQSAG